MRVQILPPGSTPQSLQPMADAPLGATLPSSYGPWRPRAVLGADSAGGLMLPPAHPTAAHFYAPRGVHVDAEIVVVADTGNHRVLVFDGIPDTDGVSASVVLGQPDDVTEGPQAGGRGADGGMNLPTGVLVHEGRLVVADAWNHRILVWNEVPDRHDVRPDLVIGQPDRDSIEPNAGGAPRADTFYWPFGIAVSEGGFWVTDTGNRRVLGWSGGIPDRPDQPADVLVGQAAPHLRDENRGAAASADSFRWPHAVVSDRGGGLLVADAGNHRALGWRTRLAGDRPADHVLGQPDMTTAEEFPYRPQTGTIFRFPYGLSTLDAAPGDRHGTGLAVADTANNRVLVWDVFPHDPSAHPDHVIGQVDFTRNGENRWERIARDTLCWPYGLGAHTGPDRTILAVADSGNNRVVLWERT